VNVCSNAYLGLSVESAVLRLHVFPIRPSVCLSVNLTLRDATSCLIAPCNSAFNAILMNVTSWVRRVKRWRILGL